MVVVTPSQLLCLHRAPAPRRGRGGVLRASAEPIRQAPPPRRFDERAFKRDTSKCDLVLSSGFLSFANHAGFLKAVDEAGVSVQGVMGTSAGALAGALYAAGYSPDEVVELLCEKPPFNYLKPSAKPCKGLLDMRGVVARLAQLLPPTFEDLDRPFAVAVIDSDGSYRLIDSGPLPPAVTASAAIPVLFVPVDVGGGAEGGPFRDGGKVDRVGISPWRGRRRGEVAVAAGEGGGGVPAVLAHVVSRSSPFSGADDVEAMGEEQVVVVRCPKSGRSLGSLGDFAEDYDASYERARDQLRAAGVSAAAPPK